MSEIRPDISAGPILLSLNPAKSDSVYVSFFSPESDSCLFLWAEDWIERPQSTKMPTRKVSFFFMDQFFWVLNVRITKYKLLNLS